MMRVRKMFAIAMLTAFSGSAQALTIHTGDTVADYYAVWAKGTAADKMAAELELSGMIQAYMVAEGSLEERHLPGVICETANAQGIDFPATDEMMVRFGKISQQGGDHLLAVDVVLEMMRKHSNCAAPLK